MTQVQGSSDCCIHSKFSCAQKGYFQDEYLSFFVKKLHPRSSIINRGYYIRFKAMEEIVLHWCSFLNTCTFEKCQIISLGAGYDSSYFRLKNNKKLPSGCHYVEIDFPDVLKRKVECMKNLPSVQNTVSTKDLLTDPAIVFHSDDYSMLGIDLTDQEVLQNHLNLIGLNYDAPTLFLSECSITYIDSNKSKELIAWIQRDFPLSTFVTYEQIHPHDAFGLIMKSHFAQVGCPLKSISTYTDEESQIRRFRALNWSSCLAISMYDFYNTLSPEEKLRVQQLELFDEYEMWHEKCHHYVLVWAAQGLLSTQPPPFMNNISELPVQTAMMQKSFNCKSKTADEVVQRFGHQVLSMSSSLLMLCGGFGVSKKKHQKLRDIVLYHTDSKKHMNVCTIEARMFHTVAKLSGDRILILGGRSSPKKVFEEILLLNCFHLKGCEVHNDLLSISSDASTFKLQPSLCPEPMPVPVWRHSSSLVLLQGAECVVVFGGCSLDGTITNKCFILNTVIWKWTEVEVQQCTPSARHTHSSAVCEESRVIISGGLSSNEVILRSVHMLNCVEGKWLTLQVSGLLPRYSHTSHVWKHHLFLVGGITSTSSCKLGVAVLNLKTLQAVEYSPPGQDPEYPILLSNHSSYLSDGEIVVVGGGGNCFSFGTYFNKRIVSIDVRSLL